MNHVVAPLRRRLARSIVGAPVATVVFVECAWAQATPATSSGVPAGAVARSGFMNVFGRLDATSAVLIVGSAVILVLLVLRILIMVRGERRPVKVGPARTRSRTADTTANDSIVRPTMPGSGITDWGHDQDKRAGADRPTSAGPLPLPDLDMAATQWSISEVHNAAQISRQANDSMGKPSNLAPSPYQTAFNPYFRGETADSGGPIEVVEVADTLLQAELLVQLGDPKQAMTLLSNHIRDTEKPGPAVWLMLLNLYQSTGRKSQYEALSTGFKTLFNASVPPWSAKRETASRTIETYPQVMVRLHAAWGKPEAKPLIDSLLNDDRGGSRQGFSLAAYRDLLFLLEILTELDRMAAEEIEREDIQRKLGRIS